MLNFLKELFNFDSPEEPTRYTAVKQDTKVVSPSALSDKNPSTLTVNSVNVPVTSIKSDTVKEPSKVCYAKTLASLYHKDKLNDMEAALMCRHRRDSDKYLKELQQTVPVLPYASKCIEKKLTGHASNFLFACNALCSEYFTSLFMNSGSLQEIAGYNYSLSYFLHTEESRYVQSWLSDIGYSSVPFIQFFEYIAKLDPTEDYRCEYKNLPSVSLAFSLAYTLHKCFKGSQTLGYRNLLRLFNYPEYNTYLARIGALAAYCYRQMPHEVETLRLTPAHMRAIDYSLYTENQFIGYLADVLSKFIDISSNKEEILMHLLNLRDNKELQQLETVCSSMTIADVDSPVSLVGRMLETQHHIGKTNLIEAVDKLIEGRR